MDNINKRINAVDEAYRRMAVIAVAIGFGVEEEDIESRNRRDRIAHARMTAYWLIRKGLGTPYEVIGLMFERDHAGIIYGCRKIDTMLELGVATYNNNWSNEIKESRKRFSEFHTARVKTDVARKLKDAENVTGAA